jgi:hypothetical protein
MITLGVINYRNFSYRCIFYIWMIMSTVFLNTLYTCRIGMIPYMDMVRLIKFNHICVGKTICCKLGGQRTFESVFLWDILGNCVFYQCLMRLSEYKYNLEFALGIIQSRRSGCAIVLFLATRYFSCRIR